MDSQIKSTNIINNRYRILRQLGPGKLGYTYLANDSHRFNQICLLQEFAPQVHDLDALKQTKELFQSKAKVLYTLDHPQIPRFRELFLLELDNNRGLFLVQDYIVGTTYRELLNHRLSRGYQFTEAEVIQFLLQLLPVLEYLHDHNIIHRDLTPDNIISRSSDGVPVLIDFGSVKQLSAIATHFFQQPELPPNQMLQIGQIGYAPQEQIELGLVSFHSDLYGLAATAIVLLTGQEPASLIDRDTLTWNWPEGIAVSSELTAILGKILTKNTQERYDNAQDVRNSLTVLTAKSSKVFLHQKVAKSPIIKEVSPPKIPTPLTSNDQATVVLSRSKTDTNMALMTSPRKNSVTGCLSKLIFILTLIMSSGTLGWLVGKAWITQVIHNNEGSNKQVFTDNFVDNNNSKINDRELQRKNELRTRRRNLKLNHSLFINLVDEIFGKKYREQKGRSLTNNSDDKAWREKWDKIAANLLDTLESLSTEAIQGMGNYNESQRNIWKQKANSLNLSSRALYDLVDAQFFQAFPEFKNTDFIDQSIGQIWNGMILDNLKALQAGPKYEKLSLSGVESNTIRREGRLKPGEGKAYVIYLDAAQQLEVTLQKNRNLLLSIYSPTGRHNMLEDSQDNNWSGQLVETGYYELTIVSNGNKTTNYQLKITASDGNWPE